MPAETTAHRLDGVVASLIREQTLDLPMLPETCGNLFSACNDPSCDPAQLANIIRQDQAIATHLLRHANSALYSAGVPINSIQQAAARLGIRRIREIALIVTCQGRIFDVPRYESHVRDSFRQSLATAGFAQEIARLRRLNVESAFLCGLLHDVGRPVLLQAIADHESDSSEQFDLEHVIACVEHHRVPVAASLIRHWKLPSRAADAVEHQLPADATSTDAQLLCLAIHLANALWDGECTLDLCVSHPIVDALNIYPDELTQILDEQDNIKEWIEGIL